MKKSARSVLNTMLNILRWMKEVSNIDTPVNRSGTELSKSLSTLFPRESRLTWISMFPETIKHIREKVSTTDNRSNSRHALQPWY